MQVHIYKDVDEVTTNLAWWITDFVTKTLLVKDEFTIALSGGETPKTLYKKLASPPYNKKIEWSKIHFFWGDERAVPFNDERNNAKMAYDNLLDRVDVIPEHIHVMRTDIEPVKAANEYEKILHRYFNDDSTFDLVLLGMGEDGHTLSLFPNSLSLFQNNKWVTEVSSKEKGKRITLLPSIVNLSSTVIFLVTGAAKAHTLQKIWEGEYKPERLPAQLIKPANAQLHWFIDKAAAAELNNTRDREI